MSSPFADDDDDDPLIRALASLPVVDQDAASQRQVRARCRALVERAPQQPAVPLEPAAVGTICAMYAWQIARIVIR